MTEKMYREYQVDHIYDTGARNHDIFETSTKKFVDQFLSGFNSSVFVYGQTGTGECSTDVSFGCFLGFFGRLFWFFLIFQFFDFLLGKTYTMGILSQMDEHSDGLIPSSIHYIFDQIEHDDRLKNAKICISMVQVYKEEVYDLLDPKRGSIFIREDPVSA